MRLFNFLVLISICCLLDSLNISNALCQTPVTDWRKQRMVLELRFGDELRTIADWCRENGNDQQAEQTLNLIQNRDLGRQYIFMPSAESIANGSDGGHDDWLAKLNAAKIAHGARIFELAIQASQQDAGAIAFQLLHEVIHYDVDHVEVRKVLGHKKTNHGWNVAPDSIRVRPDTKAHDVINWPAKSYIRILTPHFEIESNASEQRTRHLAKQLERTHLVWRQVFFEYWSSPAAVKRWIQGEGSVRMSKKRFRIVFFRDKNSYVKQLKPMERGIAGSTGYYNSDQEISFFYDGDATIEDSWRHELTHQLFRESGRSNKNAFEKQFIWLDEGIATYFESMSDFGSFVILGGFDSRRLQYARFQRLSERKPIPVKQLTAIGRTNLQRLPDRAQIYSQSAALADMLINDGNGEFEKPLIQFLKVMYKGRVKSGAFEKILGQTYENLDKKYEAHLQVNSELVEKHLTRPESRTELSLPSANLTPAAFESIGSCVNLTWLDLSGNAVRKSDFEKLISCKQISQLFLNECRFEKESLRRLELFPKLDELDLSGSSVQDSQLSTFKNLRNLTALRLADTGITDQGLLHLQNVKTLQSLDLSRTKVTNQGILKLKASLPTLQVTK
jgi:hypothetical protein